MGSKQLGADVNLAWPTAEIAVMGGQGAVNILYRGEIKTRRGRPARTCRRCARSSQTSTPYSVASPFLAAERGELDGVIEPAQTRVDDREGAALAAPQARRASAQEAREHPAVTENPMVRVAGGSPTDEELAAIVTVVSEHYEQESSTATITDEHVDRWSRSLRMRDTRRREWGRFAG